MHYARSAVLLAALQLFGHVSGSPVAQIASSPAATDRPTVTVRVGRCLASVSLSPTSSSGSLGGSTAGQAPTNGSGSIGGSSAAQTGMMTPSGTQSAGYGSISAANGFGQPTTTSTLAAIPSASVLGTSSSNGAITSSTFSQSTSLVASLRSSSSSLGSFSSSGIAATTSMTSTPLASTATTASSGISTTSSLSVTSSSANGTSTSTTSAATILSTATTIPTGISASSPTIASIIPSSPASSSTFATTTPSSSTTPSSTTPSSTTPSSTTPSSITPSTTADPSQAILASPTAIITEPDASLYYQGDDATASVQLPFPMMLFNQASSNIFVSTNGLLSFDTGSASYANGVLPQSSLPSVTLAAYWEDLIAAGGTIQGISYQVDNSGTAPSVTFEYILASLGIQDQYYHFLVKYQFNNPGVIQVYYFATPDSGAGAVIGIQGSQTAGQQAINYSNAGSPAIAPGQIVTFDTNLGTSTMSTFNVACYAPSSWPKSSC